ncbi:MAG TPA: ribosome maturation factor RimM [Allosphingosinicella sp.]|uniref:ribosome maturation factor RimM n=1 Tax=Allosphingosinicella sp. TaxID=2823234 RepID=UPI002ED99D54
MPEQQVTLAAITGAHGIGGEVRLKLFAESAESLQRHQTVQVGERTLTLKSVKAGGGTPIARFAEINDRTSAEGLRGQLLTVPRSALPPLEEGEYYHADLIGLRCESAEGEALGTVVAVENFGAGDILEIEKPDGKRTMVPFRDGIADLQGGKITVDPVFLA